MKKLFLIPLMLLATLMLTAACSKEDPIPDRQEQTTPGEDDGEEGNGRYLVLYCSRTGNTERMAQTIQSTLDCDMIVVEPETPYEDDYNAMLDRAQAELDAIEQGNYPVVQPYGNPDADFTAQPRGLVGRETYRPLCQQWEQRHKHIREGRGNACPRCRV